MPRWTRSRSPSFFFVVPTGSLRTQLLPVRLHVMSCFGNFSDRKHAWRNTSQIMTGHCLIQTFLRHPEQFEHQCFWVCGTQHFDPACSASVYVGELRRALPPGAAAGGPFFSRVVLHFFGCSKIPLLAKVMMMFVDCQELCFHLVVGACWTTGQMTSAPCYGSSN